MESNKNLFGTNDTIDTIDTIDDTAAVEAMYRLMVEADAKAKKAILEEGFEVCDETTAVGCAVDEAVPMMYDFCLDFARFWAKAGKMIRQGVRNGDGLSEVIYDHAIRSMYYAETLVGKTEVNLEEPLVRRFLHEKGWREDASQNGLFFFDLRMWVIKSLSK